MYRIGKLFRFEAAHHLSDLPEGHKCARLHGHSYTVEISVATDVGGRPWPMRCCWRLAGLDGAVVPIEAGRGCGVAALVVLRPAGSFLPSRWRPR